MPERDTRRPWKKHHGTTTNKIIRKTGLSTKQQGLAKRNLVGNSSVVLSTLLGIEQVSLFSRDPLWETLFFATRKSHRYQCHCCQTLGVTFHNVHTGWLVD